MNNNNNGSIKGVVIGGFIIYIAISLMFSPKEETCIKSGCDHSRASGSSYCYMHKTYYTSPTSSYKSTSTTKSTSAATTKSSSNTTKSTYKPSSSKKVEYPDCDDYDSFDDFMDDWDGNMPNGLDAEDYWDNW